MIRPLSIGDRAFWLAFAFIAGVLAASLSWNLFFTAITITAIFIAVHFTGKIFLWREFTMIAAAFICGAFYYHVYLRWDAAMITVPIGKPVSFSAVVSEEPTPSDKYEILAVTPEHSHTITILASPHAGYRYGDLLDVSGKIAPADYPGANPIMFLPKIRRVAQHRGFWLLEDLINIKVAILKKFNEFLPEEQAALLGGITFGSKVNFSQTLKTDMALSGTTHLVAISGYNITIIVVAAYEIFGNFFRRRVTFFLCIVLIIIFILMTGMQASAVRAGIMSSLSLFAKESGRVFNMRNGVTLTAAIMIFLNPTILIHNAGFELSFLSLLGIVYLESPFKKLFHYAEEGLMGWRGQALTTLSAQLGVMPVLIQTFGQFSMTAIGANVLVLGTVPLVMFFGFVLAGVGFVSYYLGFMVGKLAGMLLAYQLSCIKLFAALAVPIPLAFNSEFSVGLYYAALTLFAWKSFENSMH